MNATDAGWPNDHDRREIDCAVPPRCPILDPGKPVDRGAHKGVLACGVALALLLPDVAGAAAPSEPTSAAPTSQGPKVDLDLSGLEPIDPSVRGDLAKQIHAAVEPVVRAHSLAAEKIHLDVAWRDADAFDYIVDVSFDAEGELEARKHGISTGPNTEQGELADVIAAGLERYLGEWETDRDAALAAAPAAGPTTTPADSPPTDVPRPRPLGRVGWTGVGLLIAGVGAAATGGGLLGVGETPDPDEATQLRDWKPAGYGLLATGAALVVTGIVLVVVDAVPRARARRGRGKTAFSPEFGPRHAGASLRFRF